ncbi:MAG: metallophosphoesterase [Eubacteriales bacterium]|nr:metallophosphoesterase [Eubacteriales bacterium]
MKILIVSDTHRKDENLKKVIEKEKPFDRIIHLGDIEENESVIQQMAGCPMDIVSGNNDFMGNLPKEKEIMIGDYRVLLTHGHYYYVSLDTKMLRREARARNFDIAMYGHTHRPRIEEKEDIVLLNPGSLSYPRQEGRKPSYIVMESDENGKTDFEIRYLDK